MGSRYNTHAVDEAWSINTFKPTGSSFSLAYHPGPLSGCPSAAPSSSRRSLRMRLSWSVATVSAVSASATRPLERAWRHSSSGPESTSRRASTALLAASWGMDQAGTASATAGMSGIGSSSRSPDQTCNTPPNGEWKRSLREVAAMILGLRALNCCNRSPERLLQHPLASWMAASDTEHRTKAPWSSISNSTQPRPRVGLASDTAPLSFKVSLGRRAVAAFRNVPDLRERAKASPTTSRPAWREKQGAELAGCVVGGIGIWDIDQLSTRRAGPFARSRHEKCLEDALRFMGERGTDRRRKGKS